MSGADEVRANTLDVAGDPLRWQRLGFHVDPGGLIGFLDTSVRIVRPSNAPDSSAQSGLMGWHLSGGSAQPDDDIDGLPTAFAAPSSPHVVQHPNGATGLDHVVVLTGSLTRTSDALAAATGTPLKRVREAGEMRQGFHRLGRGGLIVEIVERAELADAPCASFWGFVVVVTDLDAAVELIGADFISAPRAAVQPDRRIATMRTAAGLGVPLAFMTP